MLTTAPAPPMLTTAPAPPMLVRAYLVARHDIPPMVELTWAGPSGHTARQSASSAKAADAATAAAADETADAMGAEPSKLAHLARAAACEVRQHEPGLKGAYFGGRRMTGVRGDGLVRVQYATLYESTISDAALVEWIKPFDDDHVRPEPPADCI